MRESSRGRRSLGGCNNKLLQLAVSALAERSGHVGMHMSTRLEPVFVAQEELVERLRLLAGGHLLS